LLRTAPTAIRITLFAAVAALLVLGCSKDKGRLIDPGDGNDNVAPEFSLLDVNDTSTTAGEHVSPRDQLGRISAWYFGHAT
jgi:hypothetical protein